MLFLRTTHDHNGKPKTFSEGDDRLWSHTPAGGIGHMLEGDRWTSLDQALALDRIQDDRDIGSDQAPPSMAEMLFAAAALLRAGMARAEDRPSDDPAFIRIRATGRKPDHPLHPIQRAVLQLIDHRPVSLEILRDRVNRAYPGTAQVSIEEMLTALGDLLHMGYASYTERKVAENQTLIRDHALIQLVEEEAVPA
jgi:hypothetical protein